MEGEREGRTGGARTSKDRGEAGNIGMLGQREVMPRWADDPNGRWWRGFRGRRDLNPPERHQAAGREGRAGQV